MKRAVLLLTVFLLAAACIIPTSALSLPVFGRTAGQIIVISGDMADIDKHIIVLDESEELTDAHFPSGNIYGYLDESGRGQLLEVEWDISAENLSAAGLHEVVGTPILAENMVLADGYDGIVTWPVFRIGDGASLEAVSVKLPRLYEPLVSLNGDCEAELDLTSVTNLIIGETWRLNVINDPAFYWKWDLSAVDTEKLGSYPISAELCCPDWLTLPEEYRKYETSAYVLPTDRIEIYAAVPAYSEGEVFIRWLYDCTNVTEAVLEQEISEDVWEACDDEWYTFHPQTNSRNAFLSLHLNNIPSETPLTLRLRYSETADAETTERVTQSVLLTIPENFDKLIGETDRSSLIKLIGGDRDGGDIGGADLPDIDQPAPDSGFTEDQRIYMSLLREIVTDTTTSISGLRANMQSGREKTILFEKQGVSVEIPSEILKELNLKTTDTLSVTIIRPEADTVQFSVTVNDNFAEKLDGTVIRVPWSENAVSDLACYDINDDIVSDAVYEESSSTVIFTVASSGLYRIAEVPKETEQNATAETESDIREETTPETAPPPETTAAQETETETESEAIPEHDPAPAPRGSAKPAPETTAAETEGEILPETAAETATETVEISCETTADTETAPSPETAAPNIEETEETADIPQSTETQPISQDTEEPQRSPNTAVIMGVIIISAVLGSGIIIAKGMRHG